MGNEIDEKFRTWCVQNGIAADDPVAYSAFTAGYRAGMHDGQHAR